MGRLMKEDDIFISGLFDLMNLRFGPSQGPGEAFGGIEEMSALQKEFQIFQKGRSFRDCVAVLNLGGFWNARARNRWLKLIGELDQYDSDEPGVNGNDRIMNMENISLTDPHLLDRDVYVQVEGLATAFRALTSEEAQPAPTKGRRR